MVEIKIVNQKALINFIEEMKYINSLKPMQETKKEMKSYLIEKIQENFNKGKEADGTPWKALKYRKGDPLLLTRKLYNNIKAKNTKNGVVVYNNTRYAGWQNFGTNKIPARRFIPLSYEVPEDWIIDFKDIILKNYIRK